MKLLLIGLVGSAVVGMAIGVLVLLPPEEDAVFVAEPMTTMIGEDPDTGIGLAVQTCSARMPDGSVRHTLPSRDGCTQADIEWLIKNWRLDQSMPKHCREYAPLPEGQTSQTYCWNTADATWPAREDGKCYLVDQQPDCPKGDATWGGTTQWGDAPQPDIPPHIKDWAYDKWGNKTR